MVAREYLSRNNFASEGEALKVTKLMVSDIATSKSSLFSLGIPAFDTVDVPNMFPKGTEYETVTRLYRITHNLT